jgi:hypothetical protein
MFGDVTLSKGNYEFQLRVKDRRIVFSVVSVSQNVRSIYKFGSSAKIDRTNEVDSSLLGREKEKSISFLEEGRSGESVVQGCTRSKMVFDGGKKTLILPLSLEGRGVGHLRGYIPAI